jgi:hypothetical protein
MMRASFAAAGSPAWAALMGVTAAAAACSGAPPPQGAPVLTGVYWNASGARYKVWSPPDAPDPAPSARVPALVAQIDFVFDRRLDGERIEDTVVENGVGAPRSKVPPPITVTWSPDSPAAMTAAGVDLAVFYNSAPLYGGVTSYVLARPLVEGLPSATTMSFSLDRSKLTSQTGEPLPAPDAVLVTTDDFTVEIRAPGAPDGGAAATVGVDYRLAIVFSNRTADGARVLPFVHARAFGAAVPIALLVDGQDPAQLSLVPAACLGAWPAHAVVEVTVDPGLPDAFGVPLGAGATATFTTGPGAPPATAPGCPNPDGGVD